MALPKRRDSNAAVGGSGAVRSELVPSLIEGDVAFLERANSEERGLLTIGTDPKEWWEGYDEVTRIYRTQLDELSEGLRIVPGDPKAFAEGTVGWAADQATFVVGAKEIPLRSPKNTGVPRCGREHDIGARRSSTRWNNIGGKPRGEGGRVEG